MSKEIKQLQEKAREEFDREIITPKEFREMTMGCFDQDELREAFYKIQPFRDTLIKQTYKQAQDNCQKELEEQKERADDHCASILVTIKSEIRQDIRDNIVKLFHKWASQVDYPDPITQQNEIIKALKDK